MDEIFIAIMERIAEKMPELSYIDEDYGQLEAGAEEDHYPVTFPCVLVAGLCAEGVTTIANAESIDRGYEPVERALSELGARITRVPD